jgi:hypothetical protein
MSTEPVKWYIQGQNIALSSKELKELADSGKITVDTILKQNENGRWVAAREVQGLFISRKPDPPKPSTIQQAAQQPPLPPNSIGGKVQAASTPPKNEAMLSQASAIPKTNIPPASVQSKIMTDAPSVPTDVSPKTDTVSSPDYTTHEPPGAIQTTTTARTGLLESTIEALVNAMELKTLIFFMVGMCGIMVLCAALMWIAVMSKSLLILGSVPFIVVVLYIGFFGVLVGGVARLVYMNRSGQAIAIKEGLNFCGRNFLSLFGGTLLMVFVLFLVFLLLNGLIGVLNSNHSVGSLIGAILFLPQLVLNLMLILAILTIVLYPCAIAVEEIGLIEAFKRFIACFRNHGRELAIQTGSAFFLGFNLIVLLGALLASALGPTLSSNGPSMFSHLKNVINEMQSQDRAENNPLMFGPITQNTQSNNANYQTMSNAQTPWGESIRWLSLFILVAAWFSFPMVFWICTFTRFYSGLPPRTTVFK